MAPSDPDRHVLHCCLEQHPDALRQFTHRFAGLLYQVIHHVTHMQAVVLTNKDIEEVAGDVIARVAAEQFALLKGYRRHANPRTFLAVIFRRLVAASLAELFRSSPLPNGPIEPDD